MRWLDFTAHPFATAGRRPGELPVPGTTTSLDAAILPGEYARVLSGQRDPNDPARFTVAYEIDGVAGQIAGRLNDNGTVTLQSVPPPALEDHGSQVE